MTPVTAFILIGGVMGVWVAWREGSLEPVRQWLKRTLRRGR